MKKIGFVFPGQGSQSQGMLKDIAEKYEEVKKTFTLASQALGYDLWELTQQGPKEKLDETVHTQPALLTASYAIWQIIMNHTKAIRPSYLAGHSLGEYTALVCGNALNFEDAVRLVALRGQSMQEAVPKGLGALAAIVGLEDDQVEALCKKVMSTGEVLTPANFNCPGQVVIAGHETAVQKAVMAAKAEGARLAMLLPVSVPSHCSLMKPAAEKLATALKKITINKPTLPVINNVNVTTYQSAADIQEGLVKQLYSPVRWREIMQHWMSEGVSEVVECGPGKVLTGLNKRMFTNATLKSTADLISLEDLLKGESHVTNL